MNLSSLTDDQLIAELNMRQKNRKKQEFNSERTLVRKLNKILKELGWNKETNFTYKTPEGDEFLFKLGLSHDDTRITLYSDYCKIKAKTFAAQALEEDLEEDTANQIFQMVPASAKTELKAKLNKLNKGLSEFDAYLVSDYILENY